MTITFPLQLIVITFCLKNAKFPHKNCTEINRKIIFYYKGQSSLQSKKSHSTDSFKRGGDTGTTPTMNRKHRRYNK